MNELPDEYALEQAQIERRRKLAEGVLGQAMQPQNGQMVGRFYVAPTLASQLGRAVMGGLAARDVMSSDARSQDLGRQAVGRRSADMAMLAQAVQGQPAQPAGMYEDASSNVSQMPAQPAQTPTQSIGRVMPMLSPGMQPLAFQTMQGEKQREDQRTFQAAQAEETRRARSEDRLFAQTAAAERARESNDLRQTLATQSNDLRRELAAAQQGNRQPIAVVGPDGKTPEYVSPDKAIGRQPWDKKNSNTQLPAPALKMQNELIDEIGIAGSIRSDLAALDGQLATGKLTVGPASNAINKARNFLGRSTEESQNFNTFQTTLERLRNDSLRLNKGVQTEGDAQRAWNELMGNINDPAVVRKRLREIQSINERAVSLKAMQIDSLRSNYGLEPMDVGRFANQPTAITAAGQQAGTPSLQAILDKYGPKTR